MIFKKDRNFSRGSGECGSGSEKGPEQELGSGAFSADVSSPEMPLKSGVSGESASASDTENLDSCLRRNDKEKFGDELFLAPSAASGAIASASPSFHRRILHSLFLSISHIFHTLSKIYSFADTHLLSFPKAVHINNWLETLVHDFYIAVGFPTKEWNLVRRKHGNIAKAAVLIVIMFLIVENIAGVAYAGSLTPPGPVSNTMYTLTDIYNLSSGITASVGSGAVPATPSSVTPTFYTLTEIYNAISTQRNNLLLATGTSSFGITGTLYGSTDPSKVLASTTYAYAGTAYGAQPLKTNQPATCYVLNGATTTPCTSTGQDGELLKGAVRSYTDNSDGTVTDNSTGLIWQKCSMGRSGSACATGSATTATWANALAYCNANTAGLPGTGWRLPNFRELLSIVDYSRTSPSINVTSFPATQSNLYWSATTYQGSLSYAWNVNFFNGSSSGYDKTSGYYVRCVRG